ncbi:MAG TPA: hypothetical protein DF383_05435 [Deltaproteobacteria bacterium]|nr:hypothetical protein [Deltaproteobacteria bacterium]
MDKEQKTADPLDEAKAKRLALEEARRQGRDPARHNVVVRDKGNEWEVELTGPEPRTPGDGMTVYVDKNTGALRVMLNE